MANDFNQMAGSTCTGEPKQIGEVLAEYSQSNEPFAMCVRTLLASEEKQAEKGDVA